MNPHTKELIDASKNALGFVMGVKYEEQRAKEELPPIVPEKLLQFAADQVFARLDKAVREFEAAEKV